MTPKEKAVRLVDTYIDEVINEIDIDFPLELPKRLALIALEFSEEFADNSYRSCYGFIHTLAYLEEVKHEIERL